MGLERRLKDDIKHVKRWLRIYKKEIKVARQSEDWGAVEHLSFEIDRYALELTRLEAKYKKEE